MKDNDSHILLLQAVRNRYDTVVKLLLNIDIVKANSKDNWGHTPLWWAARNRYEAVVKLLLDTCKVEADSKLRGSMIADNSSDLKAQSVHEVNNRSSSFYLGKKTFRGRD